MRIDRRFARALRRYGAAGLAREGAGRLRGLIVRRESHIWYELDAAGERPRLTLPDGLRLLRAGADDVSLLDELPAAPPEVARERLSRGARLYLVVEGRVPASACWIFRDTTPVFAARGGWLRLPPGTVCLEDTVTAPAARGRGIAPAAWSVLADELAAEGVERIITKVTVDNEPSRRAVAKAGFREAALMRLVRVGPRTRVSVAALGASAPSAAFLAETLAR